MTTPTTYETVLVERRGEIGIITLNRPGKRNAISDLMGYEWSEALTELNDDPEVGAIVMTGAGTAFSAGADFNRFEAAIEEGKLPPGPRKPWIPQVRGSKPIVAAINGDCIGAGLTRILPCDVRIAASTARLSMRFVKIGITPEIGSTQILTHLVGLQRTADLMLSGRLISAAEALEYGMVLAVVEPADLLGAAIELATEYAANAPTAMVAIKELLYQNYAEPDMDLIVARELDAINACWGTPENLEAVAAFRERRPADFRKLR